jgi:ubiquinol-cytochrome c reductase cytochrome b subunit
MFYFMLFCASSTDVMANFFDISLNVVLWTFRVIVFVLPVITYFVTYQICNEMRAAEGIGKRKRAMVVSRSDTGAYSTVTAEPRPGDDAHELDAIPVPTYINLTPEELETGPGVRRVMR